MKLMLLYKEIAHDGEYYIFDTPTGKKKANYNAAIQVIKNTNPKDRNCKITNGRIGLKQGFGTLRVIDNKEQIKPTQKERIVRFYTKPEYFNKCFIASNDNYFPNILGNREFIRSQSSLLRDIDKVDILDYNIYEIKTPYGVTNICNISTGLKTILNILHTIQYADKGSEYLINVDECGDNVLAIILKVVANTNIKLYLSRKTTVNMKGYTVYVNNKILRQNESINEHISIVSYKDKEAYSYE